MSANKMTLANDIALILTLPEFETFTVLEMRDAYAALPANFGIDKTKAQRIVYRQIYRLKKKGLLRPTDSSTKKKIRYEKTELFFAAEISPRSSNEEFEPTAASPVEIDKDSRLFVKHLVEKLQQYKLELLTSMGESDEYKTLYSDYPHLKSQLQESYNIARDNCSKLLGRVKAIETLIEQQKK
jgi:hypothetical protein